MNGGNGWNLCVCMMNEITAENDGERGQRKRTEKHEKVVERERQTERGGERDE